MNVRDVRDVDHAIEAVAAKPSFGNLLLWKTVYATADRFHVDAVRVGGRAISFPGESVPRLSAQRDFPWLVGDSQQARDVARFTGYSEGFVALDPRDPRRIVDVRYSMVPNRIEGLWGIRLNPAAPADAHAEFTTTRDLSPEDRAAIVRMLVGSSS